MSEARPETPAAVRAQIAAEREELARAVASLRGTAGLQARLRSKLPVLVAGAFGAAFLLGGGVGATMRLLFRRK